MVENLILTAAALICMMGCAGAVVKTGYGVVTLELVFPLVTVPRQTADVMRFLIVLDGGVWFVLCAALTIVFARVRQLR